MNAEMAELDAENTIELDSNNFKYKDYIIETY